MALKRHLWLRVRQPVPRANRTEIISDGLVVKDRRRLGITISYDLRNDGDRFEVESTGGEFGVPDRTLPLGSYLATRPRAGTLVASSGSKICGNFFQELRIHPNDGGGAPHHAPLSSAAVELSVELKPVFHRLFFWVAHPALANLIHKMRFGLAIGCKH